MGVMWAALLAPMDETMAERTVELDRTLAEMMGG